LLHRCFPREASTTEPSSIMATIPRVSLAVAELSAQMVVENIQLKGSEICCERIIFSESGGTSASLSSLKAALQPEISIEVEWIEALYIPYVCSIENPVQHTTLNFIRDSLRVDVGSVNILLLTPDVQGSSSVAAGGDVSVPFPMRLGIHELNLKESAGQITCFRQIEVDIKPWSQLRPNKWRIN
jgi:hypothetical protein